MFRIVEIKKTDNEGTSSRFVIQKRRLWRWWINYPIKYGSYVHSETRIMCTDKAVILFNSLEDAKKALEAIKNPFKIKYKKYCIEKICGIGKEKEIYINKDNWRVCYGDYGYEFAYSLDELKERIDERVVTETKEVVYYEKEKR